MGTMKSKVIAFVVNSGMNATDNNLYTIIQERCFFVFLKNVFPREYVSQIQSYQW